MVVQNTSGHGILVLYAMNVGCTVKSCQKVKKSSAFNQKTNQFRHVSLFLKGGVRLINLITITYLYLYIVLIILDTTIHFHLILIWDSFCTNECAYEVTFIYYHIHNLRLYLLEHIISFPICRRCQRAFYLYFGQYLFIAIMYYKYHQ